MKLSDIRSSGLTNYADKFGRDYDPNSLNRRMMPHEYCNKYFWIRIKGLLLLFNELPLFNERKQKPVTTPWVSYDS